MRLRIYAVLLGICIIALSGCGGPQNDTSGDGASRYTIQDLGPIGFIDRDAVTYKINNLGVVAGSTKETFTYKAFVWKNGTRTVIESAADTVAFDINNSGKVVGREGSKPFVWDNGTMTMLSLPNGSTGQARGINSQGDIVGSVFTDGSGNNAAVWKNGQMTQICPGVAEDINDSGQAVGYSGSTQHAFMWQNNQLTDMGSLIGDSFARSINTGGLVVGYCAPASSRACIWQNGQCRKLDGIADNTYSKAFAINSVNQIVGFYSGKATIWENGSMYDLNTLISQGTGWELLEARDINDSGQIVGWGYLNNVYHAYLLTPMN